MANGSDTLPGSRRTIFDSRITLGSIIQVITLIVVIILGWAALGTRISILENDAAARDKTIEQINVRLDIANNHLDDISVKQGQTTQKLDDLIRQDKR